MTKILQANAIAPEQEIDIVGDYRIVGDLAPGITIKHKDGRLSIDGNLAKNTTITTDGHVSVHEIGDWSCITAGSITATNAGASVRLHAVHGDVLLNRIGDNSNVDAMGDAFVDEVGSNVHITRRNPMSANAFGLYDIEYATLLATQLSGGTETLLDGDWHIKGNIPLGSRIVVNGRLKVSGNVDNYSELRAQEIKCGNVGLRCKLQADDSIEFRNGGIGTEVKCKGPISFSKVDAHSRLIGSRITGGDVGRDSELRATESLVSIKGKIENRCK